ncbi:class I SAM-dependent methyltransferase [Thiocapsa bogorovii]|uniref:class I SAM-dependent methyltransferase n=1 Tax=Thiocapsa bogorovii TaxID=521689 RepID=UPI001E3D8842|nr:class I SAM-dependent methyltransferase [Thiocapsa bogorovii]UHD15825.1 class I SAM-dependent methyltransferase [Thiocapsa bogorovii]
MPRLDNTSFYLDSLTSHGETAKGVQWQSTQSQELRFKVLRKLLPEDLSGLTLVDAGCGFGDFYRYLDRCNNLPGRYIGLDVMEPMVQAARRRTGCEIRVCDVLEDRLPNADYYLCSGAMNNLTREETWAFIRSCFAASRRGFIFNLLKGTDGPGSYNYQQPRDLVVLARELGAEPRLEEGYLSGDFTMGLMK